MLVVVRAGLGVAGQHVVVHVDAAAVVDGVPQPLGQRLGAAVRRQAQLEEARLSRRQAIYCSVYFHYLNEQLSTDHLAEEKEQFQMQGNPSNLNPTHPKFWEFWKI